MSTPTRLGKLPLAAWRRAVISNSRPVRMRVTIIAAVSKYTSPPVSTELHFVDSGLVGSAAVQPSTYEEAINAIETASKGIRRRAFGGTPSYSACRQCAFLQICPERYGG